MKKSKWILTMAVGALSAAAALALAPLPWQPPAASQEPLGSNLKSLLRPGGSAIGAPAESQPAGGASASTPLHPVGQEPPRLGSPTTQSGADSYGAVDPHELEERFRLRLMLSDLDERERAFDDIVASATTSQGALEALQAIAADTGDRDLAFTARLALREVDRGGSRSFSRGARAMASVDPFEAMQQRMEDLLENDPFMGDFFSGDPFGKHPFFGPGAGGFFRRGPNLFRSRGGRRVNPFKDLRERTEQLRQEIEDLRKGAPQSGAGTQRSQSVFSSSSSMSVENTPDGVRVEITEDDGSGPNTRVYEAPTMEALLEANPELKGRVR